MTLLVMPFLKLLGLCFVLSATFVAGLIVGKSKKKSPNLHEGKKVYTSPKEQAKQRQFLLTMSQQSKGSPENISLASPFGFFRRHECQKK